MTPDVLLQFLQQNRPDLATVYQQIVQGDPAMAQKIADLAADQARGGIEAVLTMLTQAAQAMQGGQGAPPPPGDPAAGAGAPPGPIPGGPADAPPPPAVAPRNDAGPPAPIPPAPPPPPAPGRVEDQLPPELLAIFRKLTPQQQAQLQAGFEQQGLAPVVQLLQQIQAAGGPEVLAGGRSPRRAQRAQEQALRPDGTPARPKKQRDKKAPQFELPPLPKNRWGDSGPSYERVLRDAEDGKRRWKQRDLRIADDINLYTMSRRPREVNGQPWSAVHVSSRPWQFVERVASYCTATHDKLTIQVPPWSDDDDTRFAAQGLQDWLTYARECDEEEWFRAGAASDPRMPLPRQEAGLMALMGGFGFRVDFDPGDKQHPVRYTVIPVNRLYPLAHCVTHQTSGPLEELRSIYPEIDEYYPPEEEGGPTGTETVEVIGWTDVYAGGRGGLWHCIAWKLGGDWGGPDERKQAKWIKAPQRIDFGFPVYHAVVWGGAPFWSTQSDTGISDTDYERYRGMGILTQLRKTFHLLDALMSAVATGAFKAVDPPMFRQYAPGTRREDMEPVETDPGATNYGYVGETIQPLQLAVAQGPDFQALYQQIANELADLDSPLLKGASGESGYQQVQLGQAAGAVQIAPIIDALERAYQLVNTLRAELVIRKGIGDGREIDALPYSSRGVKDYTGDYQLDYEQQGTMRYITPQQVKLNGTRNKVRFHRMSLQEEQMFANMRLQLVQGKLMSARRAMELDPRLTNPDRELIQILQEAAVTNPKALDAMIGAAALGGGNQLFSMAWQQVIASQQQAPPEQPGIPSAAAPQTGGPQGAPPTIAPTVA